MSEDSGHKATEDTTEEIRTPETTTLNDDELKGIVGGTEGVFWAEPVPPPYSPDNSGGSNNNGG